MRWGAYGVLQSIVAVALGCSAVSAATLTSSVSKEGKVIISLAGEITEGDAETLRSLIKTANDSHRRVSAVRLNSPGGNLVEGVTIADIVRYARTSTVVPNGARCASACFIIFAAGSAKYASHSAWIGVHGASDKTGEETVASGAATVSMARVVKELGVPSAIIGKLVVTPPDEMVWLNPDELRSMGATMTGTPAQLPPAQGTAPLQLDPTAKAIVPGETERQTAEPKATPTWNELVENAFQLSSKQNNGNPRINRSCQPELKVCNMALLFKSKDGTEMMLRTSEDMSGKIFSREICSFNKFLDVRSCLDWANGESHRDMKNSKGEWYQVSE
jgi:hypothetical protein